MTGEMRAARLRPRRRCPRCRARAGVPILYGFPMEEAVAAAQRGDIVLGGGPRRLLKRVRPE